MLSSPGFGGSPNEIVPRLDESTWVRHAIDHERGESLSNIQRKVCSLSMGGIDIQALCLQSLVKDISVCLGHKNNSHITGF